MTQNGRSSMKEVGRASPCLADGKNNNWVARICHGAFVDSGTGNGDACNAVMGLLSYWSWTRREMIRSIVGDGPLDEYTESIVIHILGNGRVLVCLAVQGRIRRQVGHHIFRMMEVMRDLPNSLESGQS